MGLTLGDILPPAEAEPDWRKDRKLVRRGFGDLEYLPPERAGWNATLAAYAFAARRRLAGTGDLTLWAMMHGVPASGRWRRLGSSGLVLWHGTSAERAEKIRAHGLMHKRGVWAATEPRIAHGYTRGRSRAFGAGSAMIVFVIDKNAWDARATRESDDIARFHESIPPQCIEYILYSDRIEFVGAERARKPKPWGVARFKKAHGQWRPRSRPPVRFDERNTYGDLSEWLALSLQRIFRTLGRAAAIEVFSSLYATVDPWDALEHERIFEALAGLCGKGRASQHGFRTFAPRE